MKNKGFGLVGVLIVVGVIAVVSSGAYYLTRPNTLLTGFEEYYLDGEPAKEEKDLIERDNSDVVENLNSDEILNPETGEAPPVAGDFPLYSKDATWGPCPSGVPNACSEEIIIYNTGILVVNGKERTLSVEKVMLLENTIIKTGIRSKECDYKPVADYWATYYIHPKTITFPGCEQELREIDKMVSSFLDN